MDIFGYPYNNDDEQYGLRKWKICCFRGNGLLVSSDLSAWSNVSGNLKSIAKDGNGNYVAVSSGEYGSIYKSNSSAVWNDVTPSKLPGMNAVTYGAGSLLRLQIKKTTILTPKW